MIIVDSSQDDKKSTKELEAYEDWNELSRAPASGSESASGSGSGSGAPPPPFCDVELDPTATESDHLVIDFRGNEPIPDGPPGFALYEAESFEVDYGDVVSHDPHLNTDGEALSRFLLSQSTQSSSLPTHRMNCRGTHTEWRERSVTGTDDRGRATSKKESYQETVTDFDFSINICPEHLRAIEARSHSSASGLSSFLTSPVPSAEYAEEEAEKEKLRPVHWSVLDNVPAYRGKMVREYDSAPATTSSGHTDPSSSGSGNKRSCTRKEHDLYASWVERRAALGFPPWLLEEEEMTGTDGSMYGPDPVQTLRSSKTLRQWADEYCASPKYLKEFVYEKVLYGWDMQQLESYVRATIEATSYNGSLTISFTPYSTKIYIRPSNRVSRMLSNKWLKLLSIILFIFPFIWLFKRFHSRGGGRWEVCGGAYPMKQWIRFKSGGVDEVRMQKQLAKQKGPAGDEDGSMQPPPAWAPASAVLSRLGLTPTNSAPSRASATSRRSSRYMKTPSGPKKLIGLKEGEWFRSWEGVITRCVAKKYQSTTPLPSRGSARRLDGYDETVPPLIQF